MNEHFHECPDCDEVWSCEAHDCEHSSEWQCSDCFNQLRLIDYID